MLLNNKLLITLLKISYYRYLFWVVRGGGLYRLDLAEVSNGIRHETSPDLILQDPDLGAFSVDHTNFRILVPQHNKNTVLAVSLDGLVLNIFYYNFYSCFIS